MIRYTLKCNREHAFDAWFASGLAYDSLHDAGQINCPECGSRDIEKTLMAPGVAVSEEASLDTSKDTSLARLKAHVERNADYVGPDFAKRARAMHNGTEEHRPIYGEAPLPDARKLVEDGVPIAPLPFIPKARTN